MFFTGEREGGREGAQARLKCVNISYYRHTQGADPGQVGRQGQGGGRREGGGTVGIRKSADVTGGLGEFAEESCHVSLT